MCADSLFAGKGTPESFLLAELILTYPPFSNLGMFSGAILHLQNHFPLSGSAFSIPIPTAMAFFFFEDI